MKTCELCKTKTLTSSSIIAGKYYKSICDKDKIRLRAGQKVSSGAARWNRDIDAIDNEAAIQQPYSQGKPNPKFIAAYPSKAKELFSEQELRDANR